MAFDEHIHWWYFVPGGAILLPHLFDVSLSKLALLIMGAFLIGLGTQLVYRVYYYLITKFVPRKSVAYLDYRLRRELRRRDFKMRDTTKLLEYFYDNNDGWELTRLQRFDQLLSFLGCMILAFGIGVMTVGVTGASFLLKYHMLFAVFAVVNFGVVWDQIGELEEVLVKENIDTIVRVTKKKKLLW